MSGNSVCIEWVVGKQASAGGLFLRALVEQQGDRRSMINAVEHGKKQADIARSTGLSEQAVRLTVKNKAAAEKRDYGGIEKQRFRTHEGAHPEGESALHTVFLCL